MEKDSLSIIEDFLDSYPGTQKTVSDNRVILCPFHEDTSNPNLSIFTTPGMSVPLGFYHCLACGAKGPWNTFADLVGAPKIKEWQNFEQSRIKLGRNLTDPYLYTVKQLMQTMGNPPYIKWPESMRWRGYSGKFIKKLNGYMIQHQNSMILFLPVQINGKTVGGVRAYMDKMEGRPSYLTTQGKWVAKEGLLFFDSIKKLKKDYLILVEGPRDAMRLIQHRMPACAILGATSFTQEKARKIIGLNPERVWIIPDNDRGGETMKGTVFPIMEKVCETRVINLPKTINGEPTKLDPNDLPVKLIHRIQKLVSRA